MLSNHFSIGSFTSRFNYTVLFPKNSQVVRKYSFLPLLIVKASSFIHTIIQCIYYLFRFIWARVGGASWARTRGTPGICPLTLRWVYYSVCWILITAITVWMGLQLSVGETITPLIPTNNGSDIQTVSCSTNSHNDLSKTPSVLKGNKIILFR